MDRLQLALALIAYLSVAMVLPTVRGRLRDGRWPIVFHRRAAPLQRALGVAVVAVVAALLAGALAVAVAGPGAAGVVDAPGWLRSLGWGLVACGALLDVVAQHQMGRAWRVGIDDRPTPLVTTGLFGVVRNPIFSGMLLALLGVVALAPAWWTLGPLVIAAVLLALQVRLEERHLLDQHGQAYRRYAARVGRFAPGVGLLPA